MLNFFFCIRAGIDFKKRANILVKELFRKTIHMCTAFVPLFLSFAKIPVIIILSFMLAFYVLCESLRKRGTEIPVISEITEAAARKRDENRFVLGPVTLVLGIILSALIWNEKAAAIGIFALAFGDGLASLAGKAFGNIRIPFTNGKTAEGSLTCFFAIFCSSWFIYQNTLAAIITACAGAFIEVLPLKDFDNFFIPILLGAVAEILLPHI